MECEAVSHSSVWSFIDGYVMDFFFVTLFLNFVVKLSSSFPDEHGTEL